MILEWCFKGTKLYLKKGSILVQPTGFHGGPSSSKEPFSLLQAEGKVGLQGAVSKH